jgi:NAD(P)-dependent dehydrogenase (short-subunit alcohol dehydrogenase family)
MKKRNLFMSATIMCGLFAVALTFKIDQVTWLWNDHQPAGIILVFLAFVFGMQWYRYQRHLNKEKPS